MVQRSDDMTSAVSWNIHFRASPSRVFELLSTDAGRMRFWADASVSDARGFTLTFPGGLQERVVVLDARPPSLFRIQYFGTTVTLSIAPSEDGSILTVNDEAAGTSDWLDRYAGWVSWLLILKAAAEHGVDLRNHAAHRTWNQQFVDQ